jgi:L-alanine-DL-glutamate epimerase-like enolase superfamily enzyme
MAALVHGDPDRWRVIKQAARQMWATVSAPVLERVGVRVVRLPTARVPATDGAASWDATTMVVVELSAAGVTGLGYSYADGAAATVVRDLLEPCLHGAEAFAIPALHARMGCAAHNHGRSGIVACAISAVDVALLDLKGRLLDVPLAALLGAVHQAAPVDASGGLTSTPVDELATESESYVAAGHTWVKITIGRDAEQDVAREAAGRGVQIMVDANGAYTHKQAIAQAARFGEHDVVYFEEPVSSDDRVLRNSRSAGTRTARPACPAALSAPPERSTAPSR